MRLLLGALAVVVVSAGGAATTANAYTFTTTDKSAIREALEAKPPGIGGTPDTLSDDARRVWIEEHRYTDPNQLSSRQMWRELRLLRWRLGLRAAFRGLGVVGMGLTAFDVGWKIGGAVDGYFLHKETVPATFTAPKTIVSAHAYSKGDLIVSLYGQDVLAPTDGWAMRFSDGSEYYDAKTSQTNACNVSVPDPTGIPVEAVVIHKTQLAGPNGCLTGGQWVYREDDRAVIFQPAQPANAETLGYDGSTPTRTDALPTYPSDATVEAALGTELTTNAGDYPHLVPQLDEALHGRTVPSCAGLTFTACSDVLTGEGLTVTRGYSSWANIDVAAGPDAVNSLVPAAGSAVEVGDGVTVITNPATEDFPVAIPPPEAHETYEAYVDRLTALGLVGSVEVLSETLIDTAHGPDEVVRTTPTSTPASSTLITDYAHPGDTVTVYANPPTAPAVVAGGGCSPWVTPTLDLSPLNVGILDRFPFAVPGFVADTFGDWIDYPGTAPAIALPFPMTEDGVVIDFSIWDDAMPVWRAMALFSSFIGLAWFFGGILLGWGGAAASEDD